jgi:hypothetical protein
VCGLAFTSKREKDQSKYESPVQHPTGEVNKSLNHRPSQQCVVWPLLQKEKKIKASMSPCSAPNAGGSNYNYNLFDV